MNEKTYRLPGAAALTVPAGDADKLLALGDGDCALLYLHLLRSDRVLVPALAARILGRTEEEIRAAAKRLDRAGLLSADEPETPLPGPEELPRYTAREITDGSDSPFRALLAETRRVMGRDLSGAELQTLFGIYDHLAMPPEVIMLLIHHCADRLRAKYGEGRLPTMRAIEKEAFRWAREEIRTLERAEEYIAGEDRRAEETGRVRQALGLSGRELSPTERRYLADWIGKGYTAETLALAYDRTTVSTGKLSWAYMDKIVQSWYKKSLFTPEDIEKGDPRTPARRGGKIAPAESRAETAPRDDLGRLEDILNNKR